MRILRSETGCWCLAGSRVAHLPAYAVRRSGGLRTAAAVALRLARFGRLARPNTFHLTALTTTTCNLGCAYCFQNLAPASPGTHRPLRITAQALSDGRAAQVLRFAERQMERGGFSNIDLLLFGGEPLLNPRGCLTLLTGARPLGLVRAQLVTNAVLLTPNLATALESAGLSHAQVTFDGDREHHDKIRLSRSGKPTFDVIVSNIGWALTHTTIRFTIRVNVTDNNLRSVPNLIRHFSELFSPTGVRISFSLMSDFGLGVKNRLRYSESTARLVTELYSRTLDKGFEIPVPPASFNCAYCSHVGGRAGAVVDADGTLYSCWESVGKRGYEVGDVDNGYLSGEKLAKRWVSCLYSAKPLGSATERQLFRDRIDGEILDLLASRGILAHAAPEASGFH